jgi:hypothetical protein
LMVWSVFGGSASLMEIPKCFTFCTAEFRWDGGLNRVYFATIEALRWWHCIDSTRL